MHYKITRRVEPLSECGCTNHKQPCQQSQHGDSRTMKPVRIQRVDKPAGNYGENEKYWQCKTRRDRFVQPAPIIKHEQTKICRDREREPSDCVRCGRPM